MVVVVVVVVVVLVVLLLGRSSAANENKRLIYLDSQLITEGLYRNIAYVPMHLGAGLSQ